MEEIVSGYRTHKAYHQEDTMTGRFDECNEEAVQAYYNADYYGSMTGPGVNFINNLSLSLISVFGALLFLFGRLTLGNLSSFVLYSRKFSGPINEMANIISELQSAFAAAERVFRLIDEEPSRRTLPGSAAGRDGGSGIGAACGFRLYSGRMILHDLLAGGAARQPDRGGRPHGGGKNHIDQSADAFLRSAERTKSA